jgi:hypothetical protein
MQRWAVKHLGAVAVIGKLLENTPKLLSELHRLPELLDDTQTIELRKQLAKAARRIGHTATATAKDPSTQ